jgi:hypothetical protein
MRMVLTQKTNMGIQARESTAINAGASPVRLSSSFSSTVALE